MLRSGSPSPARPRPCPPPPARAIKSPQPGDLGSHLHPAGRSTMTPRRYGLLAALLLGLLLRFAAVPGEREGEAGPGRPGEPQRRSLSAGWRSRGSGAEVGRPMKTKNWGSLVLKAVTLVV